MKEVHETPWAYDASPFRITDDIWYMGNASVASHIIDTGEGLLLIDTGYPQTTYLLIESIRAAGFDPNAIQWILHTHVHYDHIGATRALVEKFGCKTFLGSRDADILQNRHELIWHLEYGLAFNEEFKPDILVNDGDKLRFGNICVECIASPGHTPGNMTYLWNTRVNGIPYTAAITGGFYPNTATSKYIHKYGIPNPRQDFEYTFRRLAELRVDVTLGSHPVFNDAFERASGITKNTNPFIDPAEWQRELEIGRRRFCELCDQDPL